jgi:hypothetical protein
LVLEYAEFFGLKEELPHREQGEPLEGNICQAAYRTSDRLENMLRSPKSRMTFVRCLADLLGFDVEYGEGESVRLTVPSPVKDEDIEHKVPNVIQVDANGKLVPTNYELKEEGGGIVPQTPPKSDEAF